MISESLRGTAGQGSEPKTDRSNEEKKAAGSAPSLSVLACTERNYFRDSAFIAISPFVGIIRKAAFGKGRCFLYAIFPLTHYRAA